jgi:hypothetical protein
VLLIIQLIKCSTFDINHECIDIQVNSESISAYKRAQSDQCKQQIIDEACRLKNISNDFRFYKRNEKLETMCPSLRNKSKILCEIEQDTLRNFLNNNSESVSFIKLKIVYPNLFYCKEACYEENYEYAAMNYSYAKTFSNYECLCIKNRGTNETRDDLNDLSIDRLLFSSNANYCRKIENRKIDYYEIYKAEKTGFELSLFLSLFL